MASPPNGHLRTLRDPLDDSQYGIDIALIPGIGTSPPEDWPFAKPEWLATLPGSGTGARVLAYEYASPFTGSKPSWESMLMLAYDLLQHLSDSRSRLHPDLILNRPILIVCHSLGGIIVKQALCIANKQFFRFGSIVNAIAGVIFLSTPHRYHDKTTSWNRFRDILETTTGKNLKIPSSHIEQEGSILLDLADRFEGISFRTPILSVYELRESKNSSAPLLPKYQQLVNREACSTHAPMETVIGLNLNHHDTCLFTRSIGGEGLPELNKFMRDTLDSAAHLVALRLEDQEYQYATMSAYSPTMSEAPLKGQQLEPSEWPSNQATEWPSNKATEGTSLSGFELIHPITPKNEVQKTLHIPCYLLNTHSANIDFCGREDVLDRLAAELLPSKNVVAASSTGLRQFALCGFGGIGKTEIAREFSRRYKDRFDAVFWVVADEIAKLDHHYQQISLALGLEDASDCKSQVVSRELVKGWLSNPQKHLSGSDEPFQLDRAGSEATWLLIFDNADDPMVLADYWPQGSGSVLITSRDPLAISMFTRRPSGLSLGPLSQEDSLALFNHLTATFNEPEDITARQISDALGGIPLAISQMAGIIRRQDLTLSEFLELYTDHEEHASLYETKFDTNMVTYRHSLATVWTFEKLKPQARQLLELLAFLDPDIIREDLLMQLSAEMACESAHYKKSAFIEARSDLLQLSLIQRDKSKQQISVHRIVQDVILATMESAKKHYIFDEIVQILWANWPAAMPKPSKEPELPQPKSSGGRLYVGRWPACAALYPHVLKLHQLWSDIACPSETTRMLFAKLLNEAAWYQKERGRTKHFDGFFETARSICDSSTHPDRESLLADIHFCLGAIAMDASDFNASRIHKEQSLDYVAGICKRLGTEDERLYLAYAERGISRIQDRRYEEGESDLKEALRMRKALGNYIPRSGEANLSWALLAQGKLEECNTLLLDSLAGREKALGKDDRESVRTGLILYALGNLRAEQNEWEESFTYHQRAWQHMRATVGDRDFYTANVAHKIAEHLIRSGQSERAIAMINAALEIWSVDPNAHKNEIARTTFLKGKLFEATGKPQKASIALRVACRLRKEITKEDRDVKSLTTEDFNRIVAFWAR
ncbi:NB-ARC and TPR domain protein [Aspergillus homomorphus CBS 101889]|uniref:Tetratricopeptide repeat domain-containing protein n=1 Tax=Aspergillus homomorphus (strain CBS 101889) TaxID=1450537 RepID=A0A395I2W8_ASPHC|nr:tetratricopeptide repeat domain-containing protein [Aspergillus homomorphus CBS 101889]RAL14029.1 tetratricopeptide repeat domain-containing protein [Aspergillus homomorphus CBS 101889]